MSLVRSFLCLVVIAVSIPAVADIKVVNPATDSRVVFGVGLYEICSVDMVSPDEVLVHLASAEGDNKQTFLRYSEQDSELGIVLVAAVGQQAWMYTDGSDKIKLRIQKKPASAMPRCPHEL